MKSTELYNKIKSDFESRIHFLADKPEETIESTLSACWHAASGVALSAEEAIRHPLPELTEKQLAKLNEFLGQRLDNKPLAYITGRQNFIGIELLADERALIPRKETEILGKNALRLSLEFAEKQEEVRVMDICCGSGNLGLAIACFNKKAVVFAADLSEHAVELARENITYLGLNQRVEASQGDLFSSLESDMHFENTDIIVCNPPYISSAKVKKMDTEISEHEPLLAFDGGMFGTKIISKLIGEAPKFLKKGGWVIFEVGLGQGEFITRLCEGSNKYEKIESISDDLGNIRVILAQKV